MGTLHRGLPHLPGHEGGGADRRDPPRPRRERRAGRVQQGRVRGRASRRSTCATARRSTQADRNVDLQARGQGDRLGAGQGRHLHGEVGREAHRLEHARPHSACGTAGRPQPLSPATEHVGPVEASDTFRWFLGGWMKHARAISRPATRRTSPPTSATRRGSCAPTGHRLELRQPDRRLPRRRPRPVAAHRVPHPRRGRQSLHRLRRRARRRARRHREARSSRRRSSRATSTRRRSCRACPRTLREAIGEFERSDLRARGVRRGRGRALPPLPRTEQRKFDEVVTCWERARYFERV